LHFTPVNVYVVPSIFHGRLSRALFRISHSFNTVETLLTAV